MNKILTIYDKKRNKKTGISKTLIGKHTKGCILHFKNNTRIIYKDIFIKNNNLYHNENILNLHNFNIIIFNYNEDSSKRFNYLKKCIQIYKLIQLNNKSIKIFNNPLNQDLIADTFITYNKFKLCKYIKVPKFSKFFDNIKDSNFPIIVSERIQCGGNGKILIKKKEDIVQTKNNPNKFWSIFYHSPSPFIEETFISIRLFIFCDELIDYNVRFSSNWNCRVKNNINDKDLYIKHQLFFRKYLEDNIIYIQNIIDELYFFLGDGLYGHDFILVNNKMILCELGYKVFDETINHKTRKYNLEDGICYSVEKTHEIYKKKLLYYI